MKSIRAFFVNLFRPRPSNAPRIDFSYTVYWTKHVRQWEAGRRAAVREALMEILTRPGFEPNAYTRRYRVPGLDEQAHSGASLIALKKVLAAFNEA
jgi:hypothetical protein